MTVISQCENEFLWCMKLCMNIAVSNFTFWSVSEDFKVVTIIIFVLKHYFINRWMDHLKTTYI